MESSWERYDCEGLYSEIDKRGQVAHETISTSGSERDPIQDLFMNLSFATLKLPFFC